jgi:hypothetical protein
MGGPCSSASRRSGRERERPGVHDRVDGDGGASDVLDHLRVDDEVAVHLAACTFEGPKASGADEREAPQ